MGFTTDLGEGFILYHLVTADLWKPYHHYHQKIPDEASTLDVTFFIIHLLLQLALIFKAVCVIITFYGNIRDERRKLERDGHITPQQERVMAQLRMKLNATFMAFLINMMTFIEREIRRHDQRNQNPTGNGHPNPAGVANSNNPPAAAGAA